MSFIQHGTTLEADTKILRVPLHFVIGKDRKRKHEKFVLIMCCRGFSFSFEFDNYQAKLLRGIFLSFQKFLLVLLKKFVLSESF
jgi:hypothetical protein